MNYDQYYFCLLFDLVKIIKELSPNIRTHIVDNSLTLVF